MIAAALQDGKRRYGYMNVKPLLASGGTASCRTDGPIAAWSAVVHKKEYGQYALQPVAAYVADRVLLRFYPNTPVLNFTPEEWEEVRNVPEDVQLEARGFGHPHL
jgi:hypothetical protein